MSEGLIRKLLYLNRHMGELNLTEWERSLLADRLGALREYGVRAVATERQVYQIGQIYKGAVMSRKIKKELGESSGRPSNTTSHQI